VRVFLLALAIIDDVIARADHRLLLLRRASVQRLHRRLTWYLDGCGFQRIGLGSALAYILPGAVVWLGFLMTGAHPTLAGVMLGLLTPVRPIPMREPPLEVVWRVAEELRSSDAVVSNDPHRLEVPLRQLRLAS
jgi:Na+:H+ antiporter, NhaA family